MNSEIEKVYKINIFIKAFQDICEHDSHKDHYECKICTYKDAY